MKIANLILKRAKDLANSVETWADLSNALFNPNDGLLTTSFPTRAEREEFLKTKQYQEIRDVLARAVDTHGLVGGATPRKAAGSSCACRNRSMPPWSGKRKKRG
jgi:hypothetical protein